MRERSGHGGGAPGRALFLRSGGVRACLCARSPARARMCVRVYQCVCACERAACPAPFPRSGAMRAVPVRPARPGIGLTLAAGPGGGDPARPGRLELSERSQCKRPGRAIGGEPALAQITFWDYFIILRSFPVAWLRCRFKNRHIIEIFQCGRSNRISKQIYSRYMVQTEFENSI